MSELLDLIGEYSPSISDGPQAMFTFSFRDRQNLSSEDLVELLTEANALYRDGQVSIMSDEEFDLLEESLRKVEPHNPYFSREIDDDFHTKVGADSAHYAEIPLSIHMGSQNKALNSEEFDSWLDRVYDEVGQNTILHASHKEDGASVELTYRNGEYVLALTRGNGTIGRNITGPLNTVPSIPKNIEVVDKVVVVRGEILMTSAAFEEINKILVSIGREPFSSKRNAVPAIYRSEENWQFSKYLTFNAFDIEIF